MLTTLRLTTVKYIPVITRIKYNASELDLNESSQKNPGFGAKPEYTGLFGENFDYSEFNKSNSNMVPRDVQDVSKLVNKGKTFKPMSAY
ncbi:hypothetical protein BB561_003020 [Smittium simulii]|uniref:Uncharacterized protein n=1 Tax=Smittium simulii TaxID=133385 RepID=A0A2T9YNC6_9FUNG|nr:hypothetical protein BB561_003020 [Smittium simulii]